MKWFAVECDEPVDDNLLTVDCSGCDGTLLVDANALSRLCGECRQIYFEELEGVIGLELVEEKGGES